MCSIGLDTIDELSVDGATKAILGADQKEMDATIGDKSIRDGVSKATIRAQRAILPTQSTLQNLKAEHH